MRKAKKTSTTLTSSWLDRPLFSSIHFNWEVLLFGLIMLAALFTRFYNLGTRVMSHDESLHTYYSWNLATGRGFEHTPLMHGPLQFHLVAFSYFLLGDSDFSARVPAVIASLATIAFMWFYRRYLGRVGALLAAALLTISPYMLYYGRYVRNEAYVGLFGVVTFWAILRYLDTGEAKFLYTLSIATALHFTAKETSFIYTAQALLFLGLLLVQRVSQQNWKNPSYKRTFLILLILGFLLLGITVGMGILSRHVGILSPTETAPPAVPGENGGESTPGGVNLLLLLFGLSSLASFLAAAAYLWIGYTPEGLLKERAFDLILLLITLVLPQLAPFPVRLFGGDPLDYTTPGLVRTGLFLLPLALISLGIGMWWNTNLWLTNAALFYAIFTVFYTTFFTNGQGFFTGLVGSLGYWLEQQGVRRGSQPWYYYLLIQVPVYEYLPALGSMLAAYLGLRTYRRRSSHTPHDPTPPGDSPSPPLALPLIGFWTVTSLLAYTVAGEKMPWLTYHIALPMILLTAWALGKLIESINWRALREKRGGLILLLLLVFLPAWAATILSLFGDNPPFQGKELAQLQATSNFLTASVTMLLSGWGLYRLFKPWQLGDILRLITLTAFGFLALLTLRTAVMANYINYDNAKEYLVYAHSATPVKEVLRQVEEISRRTDGDLNMPVAYDDDVSWPFTWYLRNFSNQRYYGGNPTRDLREVPVIIVGDSNFGKIEPVVGQAYYRFDYIRMWWPDQDYFDLTWQRIRDALKNPDMRTALFNIWFNRDYSLYAQLVGKDMSLANWTPSDRMRMYIRKDIASKLWEFGIAPRAEEVVADPYEEGIIELTPLQAIGSSGSEPGQFQAPRGIAFAPDGSLYVADSRNHRIQHLSPEGEVLHIWGGFANILEGSAPPGTFNEPWGVAVGPDGSVYVADTWNHRIQKFTPDGQFLSMWGYFGQGETGDAFWGPRDVIVDENGHLFVSDTGNKRVVIFDQNGNYLAEFGSAGMGPGQFDEPVGIALDSQGRIYVADTWNQRIQVFAPDPENPLTFLPLSTWEIAGWYGQSLDNKPYLAVDARGRLFATDPESYRVLQFTTQGEFTQTWGDYSPGTDGFGLAAAVAVDPQGDIWVSDAGNNRILKFEVP